MDAATWARVKEIFSAVVELDRDQQVRVLDDCCAGDEAVRAEVEALIAANLKVENFIEEPAFAAPGAFDADEDLTIDRVVGHYRIVREIGRGGMGVVFLAERDDGEFRQRVALKVVSSAYLGRESLRRFRQERQILAGLNHPNIARLLDGGVTEDGLPYLVMEFVEGKRLLEHSEAQQLSVDERLRLFAQICDAVSYAHRNLIVHRDLKPSNIIVTTEGDPKLLDFGLAKMLDIEPDAEQTQTQFRALTPAYASPEHLRGEPITTASDIYSLGIVLYELLTGARPYDLGSMPLDRLTDAISVSDPIKPSSRIAGLSTRSFGKEKQHHSGDIDNIVLSAMRYEPERRYVSVEKFAEDIERYLNGLPVSASPSTLRYRGTKFVRRNRFAVVSASIIVIVLSAGIVATLWQAREARREQAKAMRVTGFLQNILGSVAPEARGTSVTMREALDEASARARIEFVDSPEILADVLMTTGKTYTSLTVNDRAETDLREALELSRRVNGERHATTLASISMLGIALAFQNKPIEGERLAREAVELNRLHSRTSGENLGIALYAHAVNLLQLGKASESLPIAMEASEVIRQTLGESHGYYLATLNALALAKQSTGDRPEAERIFREVLDRGSGMENRFRIYVAQASSFLAWQLIDDKRLDEAESLSRDAKKLYAEVLGNSNPSIAVSYLQLGTVLYERGDLAKAEPELRQALLLLETSELAASHYSTAAQLRLGSTLVKQDKAAEGEPYLRRAIAGSSLLGSDTRRYYEIRFPLIECMLSQKRYDDARTLIDDLEVAASDHLLPPTAVLEKLTSYRRALRR